MMDMEDEETTGSPLWSNASKMELFNDGMSTQTQLFLEIIMAIMCVGAVIGNIFVILAVAATKSLHSVASILIINLAISDLLVGVGVMPFVGLSIMDHKWHDCSILCSFIGFTSSVYLTTSVLTLAAIALDRYHSILHCLHYSSQCTLWRICAVVLWIWMQALSTSCPPLLGWSSVSYVVPMYSCAVEWTSSPSYTIFMAAFSYLSPAVVILFCYVKIVKVARSHARRIHTLEDSVQRSRNPHLRDSAQHQYRSTPWKLIYHISGEFVSQTRSNEENPDFVSSGFTSHQSKTSIRRFFSFLAHNRTDPPAPNSQQHHHGVMRLLMIISAFLLCWTPYIGVALVQATETAISGQSTIVPPFVITISYWLVLLNSDINPLLYALLSKRFQSALRGLGHKMRSCLVGSLMGQGDGMRISEPSTLSTAHPNSQSSTENLRCDNSNLSSSIFTVSARFKHLSEKHMCGTYYGRNTPSTSSSSIRESNGERQYNLQVPSRPQERSRLPFSALTKEQEATFFFGQITVRVEHDVC